MARTVFLTLLLANLVMLAWIYLNGASRDAIGREPQRAATQLAPERIRIADAPPVLAPVACQAFVAATAADAEARVKSWTEKFPAIRFNVIATPPRPAFDVVIAGFATRAAAEARRADLVAGGLGDGFQPRAEADNRFSLVASFADRFGAEAKLRAVAQKGVGNAVVLERASGAGPATIEARGAVGNLAPLSEQARDLGVAACSS